MAHNERLNQQRLESLQMSNFDLTRTEWMEQFGEDLLVLHNPHFNVNWEPYRMKYVLVAICHEGSGFGAVNLRSFRLQKNTLIIVLPSQIIQSYEVSADFKGSFILISERLLSLLGQGEAYLFYKNAETHPLYQLDDGMAGVLLSYLDLLHKLLQIQHSQPNLEEAIHLLNKLFFVLMGRIIHTSTSGTENPLRENEVMMQFLQLVKLNYREHHDVGFYADKMNISAKYMTTLIKKASGKSALQWIEDYVILDAKAQLSSTVNTIQQITFDLNFPSQSLFSRYFKRAVGMSPSDYRDSLRVYQIAKQEQ